MKRLLLTGASGFLGWNICRIAPRTWEIFGTTFSHPVEMADIKTVRLDLTDFKELKRLFHTIRPDVVIHTAAIRDPNFCQSNPVESHKINVDAAINIAGLCADHDIPCVFTSTDLVFDGLNAPYGERDPVSPVCVYGEQKVLAEKAMLRSYPETVICRIPLMFGLSGPVATSFIQPMIKAMREGQAINLFVDEFRTPVGAKTAASGLFLALEKVKGIIHLGGVERISRYDFGRLVGKIFRADLAKLMPHKLRDIRMATPRPPDVSLDSSKALRLGFKPLPLAEELQAIFDAML
jgi:dTDP-4-dehydrorhamnose reductase